MRILYSVFLFKLTVIGHTGARGLNVTLHVDMATLRALATVLTLHRSMGDTTAPEVAPQDTRALPHTVLVKINNCHHMLS